MIEPAEWSVEEVAKWLLSADLGDYAAAFARAHITGTRLLQLKVGPRHYNVNIYFYMIDMKL